MSSLHDLAVERLHELGTMEIVPVGTRILCREDGIVYVGTGTINREISNHLGWPLANVWMPAHAIVDVEKKRGWIVPDPIRAARVVLSQPVTVWRDDILEDGIRVVALGDTLRNAGLLASTSTRFVDAIVELRQVPGGQLIRVFHVSPRSKNDWEAKLWP